jgi:hypothetical protein
MSQRGFAVAARENGNDDRTAPAKLPMADEIKGIISAGR